MKLSRLLNLKDMKRSKRRNALKKVLGKLEKKAKKLEAHLAAEKNEKKVKKLKLKLETNKRHRKKAKKLLAELE